MNHINLKEPNPTLVDLIEKVNQDQQATLITVNTVNEEKQAVLVSLEEWNGLQETLYLSSIPGVKDDLVAGKIQAGRIVFHWRKWNGNVGNCINKTGFKRC